MAIWQNGSKRASHSTAQTRTNNGTDSFYINTSGEVSVAGDVCEVNFVQINNVQWSDDLCQWWSAEPYAGLYVPTVRRYAFLMAATPSGSPTRPYLSSLGVG